MLSTILFNHNTRAKSFSYVFILSLVESALVDCVDLLACRSWLAASIFCNFSQFWFSWIEAVVSSSVNYSRGIVAIHVGSIGFELVLLCRFFKIMAAVISREIISKQS